MLKSSIIEKLNQQVNAEMFASNLYLNPCSLNKIASA